MFKQVVYRILSKEEWKRTLSLGYMPRGEVDEKDGFIHLSTEETLLETANLYFSSGGPPVVLEIDPGQLDGIMKQNRVPSRGNKMFPHLYADSIALQAIVALIELIPGSGGNLELGARREFSRVEVGA